MGNLKPYLIIALIAVIVVLAKLYGDSRERLGESKTRLLYESQPKDTVTKITYRYVEVPADSGKTRPHIVVRHDTVISQFANCECAAWDDTIKPKQGGTMTLTVNPLERDVTWKWQPKPERVRTVTKTVDRYIPQVTHTPLWIEGYVGKQDNYGGGVALGYGRFGVGRMWLKDAPPVTFVKVRFEF